MKLSQSDLESIKKNKEILAQVNAARADTADERAAKAHSIETKKAPTPSTKNHSTPATQKQPTLADYVASIMPKPAPTLSTGTKPLSTFTPAVQPTLTTTPAQAVTTQPMTADNSTSAGSHADRLRQSFSARQSALDSETQKVQQSPAYRAEQAKKVYDNTVQEWESAESDYNKWLARSQSDEWLNAISAGEVTQEELEAFNAQQKPLYDAMGKAHLKMVTAQSEYYSLHDAALYDYHTRTLKHLLPKLDNKTKDAMYALGTHAAAAVDAIGNTAQRYADGQYHSNFVVPEDLKNELTALGVAEEDILPLCQTWTRYRNEENTEKLQSYSYEAGKKAGILTTPLSFATNIFGSVTGALDAGLQGIVPTPYKSGDSNTLGFAMTHATNSARKGTADQIEADAGKVAADIYLGATSAGDNIIRAAANKIFPGAGEALAAAQSVSNTFISATEKGATADQALCLSVVDAAIEAGTEHFSLGVLTDQLTGVPADTAWEFAKKLAISIGVEESEELVSFLCSTFAEAAILQEKSDLGALTQEYMNNGLTPEQAKLEATRQYLHAGALETMKQTFWASLFQTGAAEIKVKMDNRAISNNNPSLNNKDGNISPAVTDATEQKKAASEETTVTVSSGPPAITDKGRNDNTLAYRLATSIDQVRNMDPVSALTGRELNNRGKTITDQIADFFKSIGNKIFRNGLGDVELGEYGIASTINHKPVNRARIVSVAAAPDVIKSGRQISYDPNWKGRGYPSYIFAAPVTVNGKEVYVAAVVDQRPNHKFYLSEMVDSEGNYVRIEESPSSNSKNGVTDGAKESGKAGITARPEGLSEGGYPSTASAEPTPLFDSSIRDPGRIVNPQEPSNAQPSPSAGTPKQSLADYVASIIPAPAGQQIAAPVDTSGNTIPSTKADIEKRQGRAERQKKAFAQARAFIATQSPERQSYLSNAYARHQDVLERLQPGDKLVLADGREISTVVEVSEEGMTLAGDVIERIPRGTFYGDTVISLLETGAYFVRPDGTPVLSPGNTVDTDTQTDYNNTTTSQGGTINANGLQQNDRTGSSGDPAQGLAGVQPRNATDPNRGRQPNQVAVDAGVLRVSDELQAAQRKRGAQVYPVFDTTSDPASYEKALIAGRESDTANGWCVTPKSAQELAEGNVRTFMNADHTVGIGVAPDGDIVAVFKNQNGGPQRAMDTAMPIAIEQGGDRLDCYGEGLVRVYARYGFIPVARVEFNAEHANEGWTPEKGKPYIYVMMHNGDSASTVAENIGNYPKYTQEQLDALPTYGKDAYYEAMAYRDNLIEQQKTSAESNPTSSPNPSVETSDGDGYGQNTVGSAESRFEHQVKQSNLYANTYANATNPAVQQMGQQAKDLDPNIDQYDVITEKESLYNASLRTSSPEAVEAEYTDLITKEHWSGEDLDTSMVILENLLDQGDTERFQQLARKQRSVMTAGGQLIQAAAKYTRTNAASTMAEQLDSLTPQTVNPNHFRKQGFEAWKKDVSATAFDLIKQVDSVKNGDTESIKQIIRSIARFRKTTAWFGASSNLTKAAERALNTLDFDTAKEIALRQISQIPGDFRKRSKGEVLKSIRIKNMLSSLLTIERNLGGNTAVGIMDGLSDSTVGLGLDLLISKVTGQRTVGFDIKYAPEYIKAAKEGAAKAALCAELDISMDTDTKYEGNATRTHSPQGGLVTRFLSAYEKYLKYALEVTDKFYESGTYAAVEKSLQELGEKSNLQPEQIAAVSRKTANRRTFKDDGALATAAKGLRNAANSLTKSVSPDFGVGDMVLPFAGVGSNVTQTGIDYTVGTVKGAAEIFKLMADVKNGKAIDPGRQRKAVTDAARGVTGIGLISLFFALAAKGIIRAGDDEDKDRRALEQSAGLSGAQINIDAALRGLQRKSTQWQKDDVVFTVDFLEPFNTQMYLGYMLSQEDDLNLLNVTGATVQSIMASLMDSPMMQGLSDTVDLVENFTQAEDLEEAAIAAGEYAGQMATSFIPGYVRQFAHTVDPIYRDTTGDNAADAAWNQAKAQIPWLSKTLPAKYGADGQPLRRYDASDKGTLLGVRNNLLNPVTVTILDDPKLANALGDLSDRTGNVTIYPEKQAPKSFTVDGQTVLVSGKEMTETYQRTYMGHINDIYGTLLNDPMFDGLPDALKVKSLEYAKQYATEKAKASVSNFSLTGWVSSAGDAPATAILDKVAVASTTDTLTNVVNAWKNATEHTDADTAALDATWAIFQNMGKQHQATLINEQSGRVGAYLAARQAGMSTSVFVDLYKQYWSLDNNITLSDSARAKSWAVDLDHAVEDGRITQKQRNVLWDSLGYWTQIRQDTERYDNLVDSGLSATQSSDLLSTIAAIVPKPGKAQASDAQKFAAIIDFSGLTAKQEDAALREYMSDAQEEKYDQVLDMGLTAQDYLDAYNAIQEESGTGKKKRVIAQFQSEFNMTHAQAKALYEIYVKPSK